MENQEQKKIAILVTEGFEEVEMTEPRKALEAEGFQTDLITPDGGDVKAWAETDWGNTHKAHLPLGEARVDDYDALLLPGGVMNPDKLRLIQPAVDFITTFVQSEKPVAAICHAPILLAEADVADGKRLTSYPSLQTDLRNAGADWIDEEVVVDGNLITSRKPDDIPAFNRELIKLIKEGIHTGQQV